MMASASPVATQQLECTHCGVRFPVDDWSENQCPSCNIGVGLPVRSSVALTEPEGTVTEQIQAAPDRLKPSDNLDTESRAFPRPMGGTSDQGAEGMTLRDYFAAHAPPMPEVYWGKGGLQHADDESVACYLAVVALWRYEYADAMIEHRKKTDGKA